MLRESEGILYVFLFLVLLYPQAPCNPAVVTVETVSGRAGPQVPGTPRGESFALVEGAVVPRVVAVNFHCFFFSF